VPLDTRFPQARQLAIADQRMIKDEECAPIPDGRPVYLIRARVQAAREHPRVRIDAAHRSFDAVVLEEWWLSVPDRFMWNKLAKGSSKVFHEGAISAMELCRAAIYLFLSLF